jgi:hypothetical protein
MAINMTKKRKRDIGMHMGFLLEWKRAEGSGAQAPVAVGKGKSVVVSRP